MHQFADKNTNNTITTTTATTTAAVTAAAAAAVGGVKGVKATGTGFLAVADDAVFASPTDLKGVFALLDHYKVWCV
jgi:hypothetical protein